MKNTFPLAIALLLIMACSPLQNKLQLARRADKKSHLRIINNAGEYGAENQLYASLNKTIALDGNFNDSLQRANHAKIEMLQKIEKDKTGSFRNLKKSMNAKIYPATTAQNDTVYTIKDRGWYVVE